jgi:hypothetical protein
MTNIKNIKKESIDTDETVDNNSSEDEKEGYYINQYICSYCGKRGNENPDCIYCGKKMCVMLKQIFIEKK